jgi:hypothetical protein
LLSGDTLAASTGGTSISASYNAGVLSLTGSDTLAHYQQVLDSVSYSSTNQDPTNSGADPSRTISWVVNDGTLNSATQTTTVNITVSQAPVLGNVAASASYTAGAASATTLSSAATISDPESANLVSGTVSIATSGLLSGDTLAASTSGTSITASYNASAGVLSLTGSDTLAHYQQVLDGVTYSSSNQNPTNFGADKSRTVSWTVNDGTLNSGTQVTTLNITGQPPALGNVAASASYTAGASATTLSSGTTVSDPESTNLVSGTVSIASSGLLSGDTLAASTSGTSITASYNASTGVLSLSGSDTLAHYQQVLDSVNYSSSKQDPTNSGADKSRTVSWLVNDGTLNSTTQTTTVNISVPPGPLLGNVAASASYTATASATTLSPSTTVSDPQSAKLVSGTVSITGGKLSGDTLAAATSGTSITASYNASTEVLSLTGSDTLAHYQQVLDSVTYTSSNQNPTNSGADPTRTISWAVNDGTLNSAAQTTTLNIAATLFTSSSKPGTVTANDPNAVDLGVKFTASVNGTITGIRFYKGPQNTGTHIGDLWSASGTLLASATFTNETASGWQQVNFSTPVSITAGTTYIASYEAPVGEYSVNSNYFANAHTSGPLTAPSSASSGGNGVYAYGSSNLFPASTFNASNYWVDVVFHPHG